MISLIPDLSPNDGVFLIDQLKHESQRSHQGIIDEALVAQQDRAELS